MTRLRVVSVCPPISRFPFDCFFFLFPSSFCLSCRDSRRFFCVGQFSGVQTRPIVVAHAPSPFSVSFRRCRGSLAQSAPFFALSFRLARSLCFVLRLSPLILRTGFKYAKRLFFNAASASSLVWSAAPT